MNARLRARRPSRRALLNLSYPFFACQPGMKPMDWSALCWPRLYASSDIRLMPSTLGLLKRCLHALRNKGQICSSCRRYRPLQSVQARSLCRRVRQRCPGLKIILGFWESAADMEKIGQRLGSGCFDHVITTLSQAEFQVRLSHRSIELEQAGIV